MILSMTMGSPDYGAQALDTENYIIFSNKGDFCRGRGFYEDAVGCYDQSLIEILKFFKEDDIRYIFMLNKLGGTYGDIGDYYQAILHFDEAIKKMDKKNIYRPTIHNNRGIAFLYNEDNENALKSFQEYLKSIEKSIDSNHFACAATLNNIGLSHYGQKNYNKAINCFKKALAIKNIYKEDEQSSYASILNNIGFTFYMTGKYKNAEECYKESLRIKEKNKEDKESSYGGLLNNMGLLYEKFYFLKKCRGSDYDEKLFFKAVSYYLDSLNIKKKYQKIDCRSYINVLSNIGYFYFKNEQFSKAIDYFEKKLNIIVQEMKEIKIDDLYIIGLNDIFNVYAATEIYENYFLLTIEIKKYILKKYPETHLSLLSTKGELYFLQKEYEKSFLYFKEYLNIMNKNSKIDDCSKKEKILRKLLQLFLSKKKYRKSLYFMDELLIIVKNNPKKYLAVLDDKKKIFKELSVLFLEQKKYKEALYFMEELLIIMENNPKKNDDFYINHLRNMGISYFYIEKYEKSTTCFNEILNNNVPMRVKVIAYYNIGNNLFCMGEKEEGLKLLKKALGKAKKGTYEHKYIKRHLERRRKAELEL